MSAREPSELIKAARVFAEEDLAQTWRLLSHTILITVLVAAVALSPAAGALRYVASVVLGLLSVRWFIFYHDTFHKTLFRGDSRSAKLGRALMRAYGYVILCPPQIWADSHNYHHAHTSKIVGSSIGSYPLLTVGMYRGLSWQQRLMYRLVRSPANIALGYVTSFLLGMCIRPLFKDPKRYWETIPSMIVHYGIMAALYFYFGFETMLVAFLLPHLISHAVGSYLFYAQHTFPDMELRGRRDWEFTAAALHSSSMMDMSRLMHWFTGNIGYHHVHHLNHRIPFYRLPEAMSGIPELQNPGRTSLSPKDVWACLRLHLWDADQKRMLTWREAAAQNKSHLAAV